MVVLVVVAFPPHEDSVVVVLLSLILVVLVAALLTIAAFSTGKKRCKASQSVYIYVSYFFHYPILASASLISKSNDSTYMLLRVCLCENPNSLC